MKTKFTRNLWKRGISFGLSLTMAASLFPTVPAFAAGSGEEAAPVSTQKPDIGKAGSIPWGGADSGMQTAGQPFPSGTAGSELFRIPALITLETGEVLAAADARRTDARDFGGIDVMTSVSGDGGKTWNYSFPLYFPDSDGFSADAAAFMDAGILEGPDGTVYCIADALPTGFWLQNLAEEGTGYVTIGDGEDAKKYIALTSDYNKRKIKPVDTDDSNYAYYVGDFEEEEEELYAPIMNRSDDTPTDYVVDEWYNIYQIKDDGTYAALEQKQLDNADKKVQQNIYYKDSKFHIYSTGHIWMITSKDHGKTWERPRDISDQIRKETGDKAFLVSPGRGVTTSKGDLVIGAYYFNNAGDQFSSILSSSDNGETWNRSEDLTVTKTEDGSTVETVTTENEIVELKNGALRMFYRNKTGHICYADAVKDGDTYKFGEGAQSPVTLFDSDASYCNLSAISCSKEADGKQAILVACPKGSGWAGGRIFAFLADENGNMELANEFEVPEGGADYQYSCLSEIDDDTVALLWENADGSIRYDSFGIDKIMGKEIDITLETGKTFTAKCVITSDPSVTPDPSMASAELKDGAAVTVPFYKHSADKAVVDESFSTDASEDINFSDVEFTFKKSGEKWKVYNKKTGLYYANRKAEGAAGTVYPFQPQSAEISFQENEDGTFYVCSAGRYLIFFGAKSSFDAVDLAPPRPDHDNWYYNLILLKKNHSKDAGEEGGLKGYTQITSADELQDGETYLIGYKSGDFIILLRSNLTDNKWQTATVRVKPADATATENAYKYVAITAKQVGDTTVTAGDVRYNIHVPKAENANTILLNKGETYAITGKNEADRATVDPSDSNVITVTPDPDAVTRTLYKLMGESGINSADGYYHHADNDVNISRAEFTFQQDGEYWKIKAKNPVAESTAYLGNQVNQGSHDMYKAFFGDSDCKMQISSGTGKDGTTYFQLTSPEAPTGHGQTMCFNLAANGASLTMTFALNGTSGLDPNGIDTQLALFKKDADSLSGPLPGYRRASEIEDNETYLIAYLWDQKAWAGKYAGSGTRTEGIFLLYPANGPWNHTRYVLEDISGLGNGNYFFIVTGKEAGDASVTIGDTTYRFKVCEHTNVAESEGAFAADCYNTGYTGDQVCKDCGRVLKGGVMPALGHTWKDATVSKELTVDADSGLATADGEKTRACSNGIHTKTEKISANAYNCLKEQCDLAEEELKNTEYKADVIEKLQAAYTAQKAVLEAKNDSGAMYRAAEALKAAIQEAKNSGFIAVTSITLNKKTLTFYNLNVTQALRATVLPKNATDKTVTWTSDNTDVATVANGVVTSVGEGKAVITAACGDVTATATVTVKELKPVVSMPEFSYTAPVAGEYPQAAEVRVTTDPVIGHTDVQDRSSDPAVFTSDSETGQTVIENVEGIWGFSDRLAAQDDRFNIKGKLPMVIAFKLYMKKLPTGENQIVLIQANNNQYHFDIRADKLVLFMQNTVSNGNGGYRWPQYEYPIDGSFTGKWHDIILVNDGGKTNEKGLCFYVDGHPATGRTGEIYRPDPHASDGNIKIGYDGTDDNVLFTSDYGFMSDMRFYTASDTTNSELKNLKLEDLDDEAYANAAALISNLVAAEEPAANITATPYDAKTTWSETGKSTPLAGGDPFLYGTAYTAKTVLSAHEGFSFIKEEAEAIQAKIEAGLASVTGATAAVAISDDKTSLTVTVNYPKTEDGTCTCGLTNLTVTPAEPEIEIAADAESGTVTLQATAEKTGSCLVNGHANIAYSYAVKNAGTTGATVDSSIVIATAAGRAVITVTATLGDATVTKDVTVRVKSATAECTCQITNLTVTPANPKIEIAADKDSGTVTLKAAAVIIGDCDKVGHPDATGITYSYTVKDAGTTGATVDSSTGVVTAAAGGDAVITVTPALDGKAGTPKDITVKVTKKSAAAECTCEITGITIEPSNPAIEIAADKGSGTVTLKATAVITGNCELDGHPASVAYAYEVKDAGTTGAKVDSSTGAVTATAAGTAVITVTASLDGVEPFSKTVSITVTKKANTTTAPKTFTITFNANGGTDAPASISVNSGAAASQPKTQPKRAGYTFAGWTTAPNGAAYNWSAAVTKSMTLYAKWVPAAAAPESELKAGKQIVDSKDKITYQVVDAGKKTVIISKGTNKKAKKVTIKNTVKISGTTCTVIGIGKNAFKGYSKLTQVVIGKNVKKIYKNAFSGCKKLKKITFKGTSVPSIQSGAFKKTAAKMSVKVPKKMKSKQRKKLLSALKKAGINKKTKIK